MTEITVEWNRVTKVWWFLAWRTLSLSVIAGLFTGFILGFFGSIMGLPYETTMLFCQAAGYIVGNIVFFLMVKSVFKKRFKGFRLAMVSTDEFTIS